jgi:hypothetical protein
MRTPLWIVCHLCFAEGDHLVESCICPEKDSMCAVYTAFELSEKMDILWFATTLYARSSSLLVSHFDSAFGEWLRGPAEYESRMCVCRDEESKSVRIRNRSSVRERSERGEERRVARLCFAGTSYEAETSVGKTQLCGKKNLSCVGGAYTPPNGAFLLQRWQLVAWIKKACGM